MDSVDMFSTPNKKLLKNLSPNQQILLHSQSENKKVMTPSSIKRKTGPLHLFNTICNTPPSRFPRIINPFEAALAERLHLPLICSPSLFHRPSTPQLCSTQFEWTIDDVSSLNPVHVEAHETQFISTTDPETEAKAQAAINSYFNEKIFVPSPIDCVLRNQKIIFKDETFMSTNNSSPAIVKQATKRDGCCQTELTFPPILPKNVEDILRPYFTYTMNQQQTPTKDCDKINTTAVEQELRDASLRRKLFETSVCSSSGSDDNFQQIQLADGLSPPPKSPDLVNTKQDCTENKTRNFGSPQDNHDKSLNFSLSPVAAEENRDSFGSLSPISKNIQSPSPLKMSAKSERLYLSTSSIFQSTPERLASSSYCHRTSSTNSINMSVDGGSSSIIGSLKRRLISTDLKFDKSNKDNSASFDLNESSSIDEQMNNQSQQYCGLSTTTPPTGRRKNRLPNRKNLSQSFLYCDENDIVVVDQRDDDLMEMQINTSSSLSLMLKSDIKFDYKQIQFQSSSVNDIADKYNDDNMEMVCKNNDIPSLLCRTDSGFNEMEDTKNRQRTDNAINNYMAISSNNIDDDISMMMTDI